MKLTRIISALTGAVLAFAMLGTTAQATDIDSVYRREQGMSYVAYEAPDRPGGRWQYCTRTDFAGFLVKAPESLPDALAGLPVVPAAEASGQGGEPCCAVYPGDAIVLCCQMKYAWLTELGEEHFTFLANLPPAYRSPEYALLSVQAAVPQMQALLDLLESPESPCKLIGAVYVSPVQYGVQIEGAGILEITAETGTADFRAEIAADYGPGAYSTAAGTDTAVWLNIPFAEGAAIAERLSADPQILSAHAGLYYPETVEADAAEIALYPVCDFGTGDFNEDGFANIGDAVLLARYLAEDAELKAPTETGKNLADMDGDGTLDSADLAALLEQLARR